MFVEIINEERTKETSLGPPRTNRQYMAQPEWLKYYIFPVLSNRILTGELETALYFSLDYFLEVTDF